MTEPQPRATACATSGRGGGSTASRLRPASRCKPRPPAAARSSRAPRLRWSRDQGRPGADTRGSGAGGNCGGRSRTRPAHFGTGAAGAGRGRGRGGAADGVVLHPPLSLAPAHLCAQKSIDSIINPVSYSGGHSPNKRRTNKEPQHVTTKQKG